MPELLSPAQHDVEELSHVAATPDDHATIEAWRQEAQAERELAKAALSPNIELVDMGDGTIATSEEATAVTDGDAEPSGPYDGGGRA